MIAIIAILASMLLPALNKARDKAKGIICTNNLKQLGLAFAQYADDSEGLPPPAELMDSNGPDGKRQAWCFSLQPNYVSVPGESGISTYITNPRLKDTPFYCPMVEPGSSFMTSFAMNYYIHKSYSGKMSKIPKPSTTVLLLDCKERYSITWAHITGGSSYMLQYRHNNQINILMADYHVESTSGPVLYWNDNFPGLRNH